MHCTEKGVYRRRREEEKKIEFEDHVKLIRRKEERSSWTDCFWKWDSDAVIQKRPRHQSNPDVGTLGG